MVIAQTKIGDIFSVIINDDYKKYLQYIISDLTQLNSDVIRVFKEPYPINANPDLSEVVKGEVEFYAHCVTKWGIKYNFWNKVGNEKNTGEIKVLFRSCGDRAYMPKISEDWWIWKVNEEQKKVGKLKGENRYSEIGSVIPPGSIVHRMRTGEYDFFYPGFE